MKAVLDHIDDLTPHIKTFWFRPEALFEYQAGQYVELFLPHAGADARGQRRWFTLSSSPTEPLLAITTRFTADERAGSSFKQRLQALTPGTVVQFTGPFGDFVLPQDKRLPLLFIAVGMGITPARSIVRWLADKGERRDIHLLHAARQPEELLFAAFFEQQTLAYLPFVSTRLTERLSADAIRTQLKATPNALVYLAGPARLTEPLAAELHQQGLPPYRLISDAFPGYA